MGTVTPTGDEIAFALTGDGGIFEQKTLLLVRTLRDHYPEAPILTFIPDDSSVPLSEPAHRELDATTTIRTGEFPIDEYPHTAFQRAFELAAEEFDATYYAALDTDTVVLNQITLPREEADLYAAPMYMGVWEWQAAGSRTDDWERLFNHYSIPIPNEQNTGLTDTVEMWPPYFNSGVMVTTDTELPRRFRKMNEDVYGGTLTNADPAIETEQIVLGLLANDPEIDFCELSERQNWMMGGFHDVPDNVEVLHYQFLDTLATLSNASHKQQLKAHGASFNPQWSDRIVRRLSYFVFRGGKYLPRTLQTRLSQAIQPVFDWNKPPR